LSIRGTPPATNNTITSPMTGQSHALLLLPGAGLDSDGAAAASGGFAAGRGLPHLEQ